jgi:hypothetical protein
MIDDEKSLKACNAIDLVCREEYDFTCVDLAEGKPLAEIDGITWRAADGSIIRNKDRKMVEDMDVFPMVSPIYKRDLDRSNISAAISAIPMSSTRAAAARAAAPSACGRRRSRATTIAIAACPR